MPFLVYGSNTLFFLLYTWPFFLALMPVSVLIGITLSMLLRGRLLLTLLLTGVIVLCLFWLVFSFLTGW
ncbi:Inner membrane protein YgbE [compost metagenome]